MHRVSMLLNCCSHSEISALVLQCGYSSVGHRCVRRGRLVPPRDMFHFDGKTMRDLNIDMAQHITC